MGSDPASSLVDKFGRTHEIANLFVRDGSILPTQGSANPGLTIQALAGAHSGLSHPKGTSYFASNRKDMTEPRFKKDLAPPGTFGTGAPRVL